MRQLKLPLEIEKLIDISDPVYTFCEVMDHIDLSRYFVEKGYKTGRPRCDAQKLLKVILFAFMEKFNRTYGHYPKYPVADAGYGSYNNYLYCEEHGMEKYMKFTMYKKETTDKKYHENPYRAVKS